MCHGDNNIALPLPTQLLPKQNRLEKQCHGNFHVCDSKAALPPHNLYLPTLSSLWPLYSPTAISLKEELLLFS